MDSETTTSYEYRLAHTKQYDHKMQSLLLVSFMTFGGDLDSIEPNGRDILAFMVDENNRDCVNILLSDETFKAFVPMRHNTIVHRAVIKHATECLDVFVMKDVGLNAIDTCGQTPLHLAVSRNYTDCVDLLIKAGVRVNLKDKYGKTPLAIAKENGYEECIKLLTK